MSKEPKSAAAPKIKIKGLAKSKGDFEEAMTQAPDEEHFILRLPPKLAEHIAPLVKKREVPQDISFSFNDSRTGTFKIGEQTFPTHLVDLPCITESLKTIDNKQFYKIADISQMLIVGSSVRVSADGIWPDGLAEPLKGVRKNRFRKRMSKKVIEDVEAEVERLLLADADADHVKYEVHERKENEESLFDDDDFMQGSEAGDTQNGEPDDLDMDAAFNEAIDEEEQESEDESNDEEAESDNENEDQQSDGDNEENETSPLKKARYGLRHEIQDLEKKVAEKNSLVTAQVNPIMKKRFEEIVSKLSAELAIKREQLEAIEQEIENEAQENAVLYLDENDN